MKKLSDTKWHFAHGWPIVVLVVLVAAGLVLLKQSNLFETRDPINFAAFGETVTATTAPDAATQDDLDVWVNTSPSMAGFVKSGSSDRVPFAYRYLINNMDAVVKAYSPNAISEYYQFDSKYSLADSNGDAVRAKARASHKVEEKKALTNSISYESNVNTFAKDGSSVALPSVLNTLDLDKPALILTDFEADGLKLPSTEYQQPLNRIFKKGLCISVVAMKGAYAGTLYNYLNNGDNYAYGTTSKDTKQMIDANKYQSRSRPFYAVIVGTGKQCALLAEQLSAAYNGFCSKEIIDKYDRLTHAKMRAEDFVECETVNYWLNEHYAPVKAIDGKAASVASAAGMTQIIESTPTPTAEGKEASDTATQDVVIPQYLIKKDSDLHTATLTLHIAPPSESYADTYASDSFTVEPIGLTRIEQTRVEAANTAEVTPTVTVYDQPGILLARGGRYVELTEKEIEPTEAAYGWFTCPEAKGEADGVTLKLQVNAAEAAAGLYRVKLPVYCQHATDVKGQGDEAWIAEWTVDQDNLSKDGDKNNTAAKTANLQQQLEQFRRQNVMQSAEAPVLIAELTVCIEIQ